LIKRAAALTIVALTTAASYPCIKTASAANASFLGIVPTAPGMFDPDRVLRFSVGELHFDVPNRFLAIPFPDAEKPFDRDVCADPAQAALPKNALFCHNHYTQGAFFFKVPIPIFVLKGEAAETSIGTLGWGQKYQFTNMSVEKFQTSTYWAPITQRTPELDTNYYAAFRQGLDHFFFVRKDSEENCRQLTCQDTRASGNVFRDMDCTARIPYLADRFPKGADGFYPYSIEFGISGTEIDNVRNIGAAVTSRIDSFLERSR
jgi:hypothetical protein